MTWEAHLDAHAILSGLVSLHAATVAVANRDSAGSNSVFHFLAPCAKTARARRNGGGSVAKMLWLEHY